MGLFSVFILPDMACAAICTFEGLRSSQRTAVWGKGSKQTTLLQANVSIIICMHMSILWYGKKAQVSPEKGWDMDLVPFLTPEMHKKLVKVGASKEEHLSTGKKPKRPRLFQGQIVPYFKGKKIIIMVL